MDSGLPSSDMNDSPKSTNPNAARNDFLKLVVCCLVVNLVGYAIGEIVRYGGVSKHGTISAKGSIVKKETKEKIQPCESRKVCNTNDATFDLDDYSTCGSEIDDDDYESYSEDENFDSDSAEYGSVSDNDEEGSSTGNKHTSSKDASPDDSSRHVRINLIGTSSPSSNHLSDSESDDGDDEDDDEDEDEDEDDDDTPDNACAEPQNSASDTAVEATSVSSSDTVTSSLMRAAYNTLPRRIQRRALAYYTAELERSHHKMAVTVESVRAAAWEEGRKVGWEKGHEQGFNVGRTQGPIRSYYRAPRQNPAFDRQARYSEVYRAGRLNGYDTGANDGYQQGLRKGYEQCRESMRQEAFKSIREDTLERFYIQGYRACYYRERDEENPDGIDNAHLGYEMQALITIWHDRPSEETGATPVRSTAILVPGDDILEYHPDPLRQHPNTPVSLAAVASPPGLIPVAELDTALPARPTPAIPGIPTTSISISEGPHNDEEGEDSDNEPYSSSETTTQEPYTPIDLIPRLSLGEDGTVRRAQLRTNLREAGLTREDVDRSEGPQTDAGADDESMTVNVSVASEIQEADGEPSTEEQQQQQIVNAPEEPDYEARWIAKWNARLHE